MFFYFLLLGSKLTICYLLPVPKWSLPGKKTTFIAYDLLFYPIVAALMVINIMKVNSNVCPPTTDMMGAAGTPYI